MTRPLLPARWRHRLATAFGVLAVGLAATATAGCAAASHPTPTPAATTAAAVEAAPTSATPAATTAAPSSAAPASTRAAARPAVTTAAPPRTYAPAAPAPRATPTHHAAACGGDYYVNSSGNCVHRPATAPAAPAGATARCGDGTYSFSQHRQGTCSHHGGVATWL